MEEWRLSVNPVELEDSGLYECQVSTTPHISHFMRLTVIGENEKRRTKERTPPIFIIIFI